MRRTKRASRTGQPPRPSAILAAGSACALLANPAGAVELGELAVESTLGQPLAASIAFALGPNEQLGDRCVYLRAGSPAAGLPAVTRASAVVEGNRIVLRGSTALREPMMSLKVVVDCPYTARLQRDYLLMLNPPSRHEQQPAHAAATSRAVTERGQRAPVATPAPRRAARPAPVARSRSASKPPIAAGGSYLVQPGDTLSEIVSRIEDRRLGLWPAIDTVFAENPRAFRDGNVDLLIAGATLRIPRSVVGAAGQPPSYQPAAARAYGGAAEAPGSAAQAEPVSAVRPVAGNPAPPVSPGAQTIASGALPSGIADSEAAGIAPRPATNTAAPAQPLAGSQPVRKTVPLGPPAPAARAATPVAGNAPATGIPPGIDAVPRGEPVPLADAGDNPAQSWLVWLGGSGIAIFLALLIFGRRLRERFGAGYAAAGDDGETQVSEALPNRRSTDARRPSAEPSTGERRALDVAAAGSIVGSREDDTDFDTGDELDVALDFSFESSGEYQSDLDFIVEEQPPVHADDALSTELWAPREEPSTADADPADTSLTAGMKTAELPAATRPGSDRETIEVAALDNEPHRADKLDMTTEFDYHILERDYEDELSATQALNVEIEQAARELQDRLGADAEDSGVISVAADLEGTAEVTAEMPRDMVPAAGIAGNEALDAGDSLDDTDVTEVALDDALTSKLPDSDETVEMDPDATVERRSKTG